MSILDKWINSYYLLDETVENIRESIIAKPSIKYAVLDDFFNTEILDSLIISYDHLKFSEKMDKISENGDILPYDSSVCFADTQHFGSELFFDDEWHRYCCYLLGASTKKRTTEVKMRRHKSYADGFWIHTDSTIRSMVIIAYFNKNWRVSDGALLQLWRVDEAKHDDAISINMPSGRMDFLNKHQRIRTRTPGGGFNDNGEHDLVLIDQIVPTYNRLFICNFDSPVYHSITPSMSRERFGFVQWLH